MKNKYRILTVGQVAKEFVKANGEIGCTRIHIYNLINTGKLDTTLYEVIKGEDGKVFIRVR